MKPSESARRELHDVLVPLSGIENTETLMEHLPSRPEIDERFDRVDERFKWVDHRFDRLEERSTGSFKA